MEVRLSLIHHLLFGFDRNSLAKEYGLDLIYKENFHPFYQRAIQDKNNASLLQKIGVVGGQGPEMTPEEWEAAGIYLAFAFQKR